MRRAFGYTSVVVVLLLIAAVKLFRQKLSSWNLEICPQFDLFFNSLQIRNFNLNDRFQMKSISNCCHACLSISIKNESQFFEEFSPCVCVRIYPASICFLSLSCLRYLCLYLSLCQLLTQLYSLSRCRHYSADNSVENLRELAAAH